MASRPLTNEGRATVVSGHTTELPEANGSEEFAALSEWVIRLVHGAVRRHRLPHYEQDLAQEALHHLLEEWRLEGRAPTEEHARVVIERIAGTEAQRRRREFRRLRVPVGEPASGGRKGIPALCPRLAEFGSLGRRLRPFLLTVHAAAQTVAKDPGVLRDAQFRLFQLAYVDRGSRAGLAELLGVNPRAVTKRLQRVSHRIEEHLIGCLAGSMSPDAWGRVSVLLHDPCGRKVKEQGVVAGDGEWLCETVLHALIEVIHRGPGVGHQH